MDEGETTSDVGRYKKAFRFLEERVGTNRFRKKRKIYNENDAVLLSDTGLVKPDWFKSIPN